MSASTLVIQPLPGIGDMVWHLPYIHAVAAQAPGGKVDVLTKPRSRADQLLADDPAVGEVLWLDRKGSHRGVAGLLRLAAELRGRGYESVWVFHNSLRYALAVRLAGIPQRYGFGSRARSLFYNRLVRFGKRELAMHPIEKGRLFLESANVEAIEAVPVLPVSPSLRARMRSAFREDCPGPWFAVGIGSSEPFKQWGAERFSALIRRMHDAHGGSFFLLGGPAEAELADSILTDTPGIPVVPVLERPIRELVGLIAACDLYVGNDTGFLNIAAAVDVPAVGLFGGSPPLGHDPRIVTLLPEDGSRPWYGSPFMDRISVGQVAAAVGQRLESIR